MGSSTGKVKAAIRSFIAYYLGTNVATTRIYTTNEVDVDVPIVGQPNLDALKLVPFSMD